MSDDRETIKVSTRNWKWLNSLKEPGDSFDDVISRLRFERDEPSFASTRSKRPADTSIDEDTPTRTGADHDADPTDSPDPSDTDLELTQVLDVPGSGEEAARRKRAIATMYRHLREEGQATKQDFLELVDPADVGYEHGESVWSNLVKGKETLSVLPGVHTPPEGRSEWRYVPEDDRH